MITESEWLNEYMKMIGMTEDEIKEARSKEREHVRLSEEFFKRIQNDAYNQGVLDFKAKLHVKNYEITD